MSSTRASPRAASAKRSTSFIPLDHSPSKAGPGMRDQRSVSSTSPTSNPESLIPIVLTVVFLGISIQARPTLLFEERFEDINLKQRGWYDLADGTLASFTSREHAPGGERGLEIHFRRGDTSPTPRVAFRHLF